MLLERKKHRCFSFSLFQYALFVFFLCSERGDTFDWEELIDQEAAKRRSSFDEIPSGRYQKLFMKISFPFFSS